MDFKLTDGDLKTQGSLDAPSPKDGNLKIQPIAPNDARIIQHYEDERQENKACCKCLCRYTEQSSLLTTICKGTFALAMVALAGAPFCASCLSIKTSPKDITSSILGNEYIFEGVNATISSALASSQYKGDIHYWNAMELSNLQRDFDMESHSFLFDNIKKHCSLPREFILLVSRLHMFYRSVKHDKSSSNYAWNVVHLVLEYYDIEQFSNVLDVILTPLNVITLMPWDDAPFCQDTREMDEMETHSVGIEKVRKVVDTWKQVSECELATKADLLVQGLISCGLVKILGLDFSKRGYELMFGKRLPSLRAPSLNMTMYRIVDFVVTVVESCHECFISGDLQPLIVRDRRVRDFLEKHQKLSDEIDTMSRNMKVNGFQLIERAKDLYAEGLYLQPTHPMVTPFVKDLAQKFQRVKSFFGVPSIRKPPFSILIHSAPGMGKTMIGNLIASVYAHTVNKYFNRGLVFNPQTCMHSFNPDSKFMDGYKGSSTWWIHCDDLAKEHKKHVASGIANGLARVIDLINPCGRASEQAAVEDKGTIPVDPALVTASTNVKGLNAFHAVETPSALLRRLGVVVTPKLKDEFIDDTGFMKKLSHIEFDAHTFKIERVRVNADDWKKVEYDLYDPDSKTFYDPNKVTMMKKRVYCNKHEFVEFLVKSVITHERNAEVMFEQSKMYSEVTYCSHFYSCMEQCPECEEELREDELYALRHTSCYDPEYKEYVNSYVDQPESTNEQVEYLDVMSKLESHSGLFSSQAPDLRNPLNWWQRTQLWGLKLFLKYCPHSWKSSVVNYIFYLNPNALSDFIKVSLDARLPPKVHKFITVKNAIIAAGGISALYVAFRLISGAGSSEEEEVEAMGNVWHKEVKAQDFFTLPETCHKNNDEEILSTVRKSLIRLSIKPEGSDDSMGQEVNVVAVGNSQYLTVNHAFTGDGPWICVANYGKFVGNTRAIRPFKIDNTTVRRIPHKDLLIFTTASILPRKSLRKHLLPKEDLAARHCKCITLEPEGEFSISRVFHRGVDVEHKISYRNVKTNEWISIVGNNGESLDAKSKRGDCGSVVVAKSSRGWFISGIRVAGAKAESPSRRAISSPISMSSLEPFLDYPNPLSYLDSKNSLDTNHRTGELQVPYRKGIHTFVEPDSNVLTLGSFQGRRTHTSQVKRTIIADDYEKMFGITIDAVPPLMKPVVEDDKWLNPYTLATQVSCNQSPFYLDSEIIEVADSFIHDTTLNDEWLKDVRSLDMIEAINGIKGDDLLNCMPMNTSGGLTFPGKKNKYFDSIDDVWYPKPELMQAVKNIEDSYAMGKRANIIFQGCLKDEPVTLAKRKIGKTRVFTACPVSFSIVVRKQFLTLTKAMRKENFLTECAVGMNCYSEEWGDLFKYLTAFGDDNIVAGDYKFFDKEMAANLIRGAFHVLISWRKRTSSTTYKELKIMEGIATDICQPIVNMNGDVFQFFGSNPSGQPLTAIVNSIVNSIYMRIAYKDLGGSLCDFKKQVNLMTYGDDNILNTDQYWFNHTAIQESLRQRGVTYTMAIKDAESVPFIHISEADFLKRRFVLYGERIIAPLDVKSIHKMVGVMVEKGNVSEEEVIAQSYLSARMEMSLHGKEAFDSFDRKMRAILVNYPCVNMLLTQQHTYSFQQTFDWVCGIEHIEETL